MLHLSISNIALLICSLLSISISSVHKSLFHISSSSSSVSDYLWQQGWGIGCSSPCPQCLQLKALQNVRSALAVTRGTKKPSSGAIWRTEGIDAAYMAGLNRVLWLFKRWILLMGNNENTGCLWKQQEENVWKVSNETKIRVSTENVQLY